MRPEPMLTERDLDEVDAMLIPAAESLHQFNEFMRLLGVKPREALSVLRERLPVARAIVLETDKHLH